MVNVETAPSEPEEESGPEPGGGTISWPLRKVVGMVGGIERGPRKMLDLGVAWRSWGMACPSPPSGL